MNETETEEEMLIRVGRLMFGENVSFTPDVIERMKGIYRKYREDMRQQPLCNGHVTAGDPDAEFAA